MRVDGRIRFEYTTCGRGNFRIRVDGALVMCGACRLVYRDDQKPQISFAVK